VPQMGSIPLVDYYVAKGADPRYSKPGSDAGDTPFLYATTRSVVCWLLFVITSCHWQVCGGIRSAGVGNK
jgi:hypothetical protein